MPELDRRDFLKVVGLTAGAVAAAGCQEPVEKVIPYLNQPEEVIPGIATYYNSTCRECPVACGIRVKTREGRPIKVEGNPDDPVSRGSLCVRGQASLYRTYDASRFKGPMVRRDGQLVPIPWEEGLKLLVEKLAASAQGKVFFLGGLETGTLDELVDRFLDAIGSPHRVRFELFAYEALRTANERLFGRADVPHFALDRADVVVSFGTDFIETWLNPLQNQVNFSRGRREGRGFAAHIGPRLGLSGSNADLWLAPKPGTEVLVALALAHGVAKQRRNGNRGWLAQYSAAKVAERTGLEAAKIDALAHRISKAHAPLALPPGNELLGTNAAAFTEAVQILNHVSGAIGKTVVFGPDHKLSKLARFRDIKELAGKMRGGEVSVLLLHGANPVYSVPQIGFADAMGKSDLFTVSFSSASDETTALADLVLPDHTPYESWGDAEPIRGVRRLQQPTVRPLMDTRAVGDVLLDVARRLGKGGSLPGGDFRDLLVSEWGAAGFDAALARGGTFKPASSQSVALSKKLGPRDEFAPAELGGDGDLVLVAYPSLHLYDGRSARIAMLQEIPDPVLKTTWESFAELHPDTAKAKGIRQGDIVRVSTEAGSIELPAFPHKAVRPGVVAIAIGRGHQPVDPEVPESPDWHKRRDRIGANVLELLPGRLDASSGGLAWLSAKAKVESTGRKKLLAVTQQDFDQQGRGFAQSTTMAALLGLEEDHGGAPHLETKEYDAADDAAPESPYRWGMSIDLDACSGCNACISACNQENNIATIGEDQVRMGREMHWIRIERYVDDDHGALHVQHSPMLCQHCGAAPCESVCPVLATYHNEEGLNVMVYNRCIGTRYCSNNCPYKVRRFNHFAYDQSVREPENLALNPDVTVRSKGVMEKCTFCVQRIIEAKDEAVNQGRNVREGEVTPACAQSCPSHAIVFGNLKDPESRVSRLRQDKRAYRVLDHLYTRPAVSYLKSIRRNESPRS
ncbi:MAG: 4Fe-4S dicluster domain-containing protein [Deltaproteobacteria bacterium]|nr:4Fe-4S dicluster domain-containing protein [Deltaproteobacteria bacterium]